MDNVGTQTETNPPGVRARLPELTADVQRGFVAEWAVTIILLLFGTTTLVQAFVIPSASMVGTLLIGDHVLVDKLVYAPAGALAQGAALPRAAARRHHRIPLSAEHLDGLRQARDRRPGRSYTAGEQATDAERPPGERALRGPQPDVPGHVPRQLPLGRALDAAAAASGGDDREVRGERRTGGAAGVHFRHGRQSRRLRRQPLLGAGAAREHRRDRR